MHEVARRGASSAASGLAAGAGSALSRVERAPVRDSRAVAPAEKPSAAVPYGPWTSWLVVRGVSKALRNADSTSSV